MAGMELCGASYGWQARFARRLKVDRSAVSRWLLVGVRGPTAELVKRMLEEHRDDQSRSVG